MRILTTDEVLVFFILNFLRTGVNYLLLITYQAHKFRNTGLKRLTLGRLERNPCGNMCIHGGGPIYH
jgi:hypothetical protein